MIAYLSGPMTGPRRNFDTFEDAAHALRAIDVEVLSPHEKAGFDPDGLAGGAELGAALKWDVDALMRSGAVVTLPGWEGSAGCAVEIILARSLGIPVMPLDHALLALDADATAEYLPAAV